MSAPDEVIPVHEAMTYEWECDLCGARTWTPGSGGRLDWDCKCDHDTTGSDGHGINIYRILSGRRWFWKTCAGVEGRKPGEPSNRKLHLETCDGTCEGCKWHADLVAREAAKGEAA